MVRFTSVEFKCGIGIDHGYMRVIKVGVPRHAEEGNPNKGLVLAGKPANMASRLTDMDDKTITETKYDVTRFPYNPKAHKPVGYDNASPILKAYYVTDYDPKASAVLNTPDQITLNEAEFLNYLTIVNCYSYTKGGQIVTFIKRTNTYTYPTILITDRVYKGIVAEAKNPQLFKAEDWPIQPYPIRNVDSSQRGSNLRWGI